MNLDVYPLLSLGHFCSHGHSILNIEEEKQNKTKQQSGAKVSQWEWKPYEDERHEHVCECVVG